MSPSPLSCFRRMALKEWCQQLQPVQLYIMLTLTSLFFTAELAISHFTHSLTLLMDSYHMLCNIIALIGCLITIKKLNSEEEVGIVRKEKKKNENGSIELTSKEQKQITEKSEKSLKNTFGWARIDVLVMMIGSIFLFSLCFSLLVEALQTLVHIDHQDEMHFPITVLVVASVGLLLNGLCYLLIGGYTFHQGSFLHVTADGNVILDRRVTADSLRQGQRRLSSQTKKSEPENHTQLPAQRQGAREMIRDVISCIFVIVCASIVYLTSGHPYAKYLDPAISILSAFSVFFLSYPYMKESGLILLQTIPNDINIDLLRKELLQEFPDIVNIHDLHVWQFTTNKVFATSHMVFQNTQDFLRINKQLTEFFTLKGITKATTQAEFLPPSQRTCLPQQPCLMPCLTVDCRLRNCCVDETEPLEDIHVHSGVVHRKKICENKNEEVEIQVVSSQS